MKEKQLSLALGLSRDVLKKMRSDYSEGVDWNRIESRKPKSMWEVQWTEEGIKKLKDTVGLKEEEKVENPKIFQGTVVRRFLNKRMLQVKIEDKEESVLCRDNTKFTQNMPVWVKWDGRHWVINRHPRFNGKY
jgi:hypothetical protein